MPNWCQNQLSLEHVDNPAEIKRLFEAAEKGEFLQAVCPMPKDPQIVSLGDERLESLPAWYNWRLHNWGCKWDVEGQADLISPTILSFSFDSPWGAPIQAYEKLLEQGFSVQAYYHEMGMAFMGEWSDGEDDYIEYTCDKDAGDIPENWYDIWNMGEHFAMLEEINEED